MKKIMFELLVIIVGTVDIIAMDTDSIYNRLLTIENSQINRCKEITPIEIGDFTDPLSDFTDPLNTMPLTIYSLFNPQVYSANFEEKCNSRCILDFSRFSFAEIVGSFIQILQSKLNARRSAEYTTHYRRFQNIDNSDDESSGETYLDPYYTKIRIDDQYYNFSLDYDGGSDQPGNCVIRLSRNFRYFQKGGANQGRDRTKENAKEWYDIQRGSILEKLILASEVARRKVKDGGITDRYAHLPIWCAIVIAKDLGRRAFSYRIFSGGNRNRENGIKFIIHDFLEEHRDFETANDVERYINSLFERDFPPIQ